MPVLLQASFLSDCYITLKKRNKNFRPLLINNMKRTRIATEQAQKISFFLNVSYYVHCTFKLSEQVQHFNASCFYFCLHMYRGKQKLKYVSGFGSIFI